MKKTLTNALISKGLVVTACLFLFSLNQVTAEVILFADTFTAANSEMNVYAKEGQSGSITTPIGYTFTGGTWQTQISNNSALLYSNGDTASFSLAHNFTNGQQLRISSTFTMPQGTAWIKFGSGANANFNAAGGAAFTFDNTGAAYLFDGATGANLGTLLQANNNVQIDINSSQNYTGAGTVGIDVRLNGTQLDLNGNAIDGTTYFTTSGFTDNFITFAQYSGGFTSWTVQDWQVSSIPEPSSYALMLGGIASLLLLRLLRHRVQS